jgi:hypothetical protein
MDLYVTVSASFNYPNVPYRCPRSYNDATSHISEISLQSFFFTLEIDFLEKRLNFSGLCSLKIVSKDGN